MDIKQLLTMCDALCSLFSNSCKGCPIFPGRKKHQNASCDQYIRDYKEDVELTLATWIGGVDFVEALGEHERKKAQVTRREILQAAERCVCGDRDQEYGGPEDSFALIARLWEPIIRARCVSPGADVCVDAVTVALLMAELKIARATTNETHMDSYVDGCGYLACAGELAGNEEKTGEKK